MTTDSRFAVQTFSCPADVRSAVPLPLARWTFLLVLLLAELAALTIRFETGPLLAERGWWAYLLGRSSQIVRLGSVIALTTLVLAGASWWRELRGRLGSLRRPPPLWLPLLGHVLAMTGFAGLTAVVLEGHIETCRFPGVWVLGWGATLAVALLFWIAAALPVPLWRPLARRGLLALVAGIALGGAAWGAAFLAQGFWGASGRYTLWTVHQLLGAVAPDAVYHPADFIVGTRRFRVHVAPACSGLEGIGLIVVFLVGYLWWFRFELRFPAALCLVPLGAVLIWLANVVRIALLVLIGSHGAPKVAFGGFHSQAGWLAFLGLTLGMVAITRRLRWFSLDPAGARGSHPAASYLMPLLAILGSAMLTRSLCAGFDPLYPVRVLAAIGAFWVFRRAYPAWPGDLSFWAIGGGVIVFGLWLLLQPAPTGPTAASPWVVGLAELPPGLALAWLVFRVVGTVVTVPLAEELAFRAYLSRRLISADFESVPLGRFTWLSFVVSAAAFGALHDGWLAGTIAGMLYALVLARRGRLADAVIAHGVTNAMIAVYVLTTGAWYLWS